MKEVSIVILNWNGKKHLERFLPPLVEHTVHPGAEIVVADNGSEDDSLEFLAAPFMGAAEQAGRLAKLYLALYEECEKFEHYGEAGNFGLTMASYGNLNRQIDREN